MKVFAHRGFSALYPENTLLAFQKAIEAGADGIETDLRLTCDGRVVLFHDDELKRLTGRAGRVESLTLEQLKTFKVGKRESIPTLEEALELVQGKVTLILEIKYMPETYKKICEIVAWNIADKTEWVEVSCFEDRVLAYMHGLDASITLHKLIADPSKLSLAAKNGVPDDIHCLDINVSLREDVMKEGLLTKYRVIFWTVDNEDLEEAVKAGLYGVMTNDVKEAAKRYK